ncbi:hypothetical protein MK805_10145 [Shimazuella sp. AN120528]|uniref:hypothetical protein n=1 Tax=Shimazuella soli TaxID=1892854 RepID=UPI001F0DD70D|nr:hypothetical protein [Shimazuella soli]MCH5585330.1 hypothetical protein [Shimazuella soli]
MELMSLSGHRIFLSDDADGEHVLIVNIHSGGVYERVEVEDGAVFTPLMVNTWHYWEATEATSNQRLSLAEMDEEKWEEYCSNPLSNQLYVPASSEDKYWSFIRVFNGLEVRGMPNDGAPLYGGEFRITGDQLTLSEFCWEDGTDPLLSTRTYTEALQVGILKDGTDRYEYGKFAVANRQSPQLYSEKNPGVIRGIHGLTSDYFKLGEINVIPIPSTWTPDIEKQDSVWERKGVGQITVLVQETQSGPQFRGILHKEDGTEIPLTPIEDGVWFDGITLGCEGMGQFNLWTDWTGETTTARWIDNRHLGKARKCLGRVNKQWAKVMNRLKEPAAA